MSSGNWTGWTVDLAGKCRNGPFATQYGIQVEIYKNYVQLRFAGWEGPVLEMWEGHVEIGGFRLWANRGPQNGVYVVTTDFVDEYAGMVGCGVYGWTEDADGDAAWVGLKPSSEQYLKDWLVSEPDFPDIVRKVQW
jgi:hypothetical protein